MSGNRRHKLKLALMLGVFGAAGVGLAPAAASAQGAGQAASSLDEVVVTARRREENIQDVPVSVSVQSGEALQSRNVDSLSNLGKVTPGLTVTPSSRGGNTPNFVLRGQRTIDIAVVLDPVIVTYFNDMPYMRAQGLNAALFDVQSVQVLRGPQGTLFGRNSTGGAILVNTNPASANFGGTVSVSAGSYDMIKTEGAINIPLGERAAIRFAGVFNTRDGYVRNRVNGERFYDVDYNAQRVTLHWEPIDGLTNDLYLNRYKSKDHGAIAQLYGFVGTATTNPLSALLQANVNANLANPLSVGSDYVEPLRIRPDYPVRELAATRDLANVTTFKVSDALTLKNIFGLRRVVTKSAFDLDGSSAHVFRHVGVTEVDQVNNEFQVQGTNGDLDWIVGLFYFRERGSDISNQVQATSPTIFRRSGIHAQNTSKSIFGSADYRFGDSGFSLSAGARYTKDIRENDGVQVVGPACGFRLNSGALIAAPCLLHQKVSFSEPSWSVSLSYEASPDLHLYAAHRHGYRSGGLQSRATTEAAAVPFHPEKVNDIELGVKFNLPDGRGRINAAVYRAWYSNVQRQIAFFSPVSNTLVSGILNAASSHITGGELEVLFRPTAWLELSGSTAYVDAKYTKFVNGGVDISDTPFAFVPKWTANAEADVKLPIPAEYGALSFNAAYRYQSKVYNSDTPQFLGWLPSFGIVDMRLDWREIMGSDHWRASAFMTNVFDKRYYPFANNFTTSTGFVTRSVGAPRMSGVRLTYDF